MLMTLYTENFDHHEGFGQLANDLFLSLCFARPLRLPL